MNDILNKTPTLNSKKKLYFPNLNGIRALAASMVLVCHIELHKVDFHLKRLDFLNVLNFGRVGVTVFFSLSGFLITYLLLEEKRNFTAINFKDFYIRRTLRIWPLYFLTVFVGFFVYPHEGSTKALWLSLLFLPNLAFCLHLLPVVFDTIWSIGTEEQFYIFHPHFFRIKKISHILYTLLVFILFIWTLGVVVVRLPHEWFIWKTFNEFFYYARFDNMMIGAVVAVLYFNTKHPTVKFKLQSLFDLMFNKYFQVLILLAFIIFTAFYLNHYIAHGDVILSILSSLLIVNLCQTNTSIYSLQGKSMKFIGQISYGIYLLHKFPLFLILFITEKYMQSANLVVQNIIIYCFTIACTIALASLSFYAYETPFLNLKKRFQKITQ